MVVFALRESGDKRRALSSNLRGSFRLGPKLRPLEFRPGDWHEISWFFLKSQSGKPPFFPDPVAARVLEWLLP